jgi:uncharacterized protein (DUF1330 family)
MAAYMIVTARIRDRERFVSGYGKRAAELVAQFGGRYVIRGPGGQVLEGADREGVSVVISEWPSREAALSFWNSPEYAEAKALREGLAEVEVVLIEGPRIEGGA